MTGLSLGLVLLSAVAHATWNFLLKRSGHPEVFLWLLLVSASIFMVPVGVTLFWFHPFSHPGWAFVLATVAVHILYVVLLGRSYALGDLSLVYPIARGIAPMLVPILAVVIFGENVAGIAIVGIVFGIYTVSWTGNFSSLIRDPLRVLKNSGTRYAILTGLVLAGHALIDKRAVGHVQPFLYIYLMTLGSALGLSPYMLRRWGTSVVGREWRANSGPIIVAGLLTFLAYGLVLTAFTLSQVSYVSPVREVGIVFGVLLGVCLLKEPFGGGRLLGSGLIVLGVVLVVVSP